MVPPGRSLRLSALVLSAAALAMVVALAGSHEAGAQAQKPDGAPSFDLTLLAPASDEATFGFGRTLSQVSARRSGPLSGAALVPSGSLLNLYISALVVLLVAVRIGPAAAPQAQPSPRGPPAV